MEDGSNGPLWACLVYLVLIAVSGILAAFSIALRNADDDAVEKKAKEGDRRSVHLKKYLDGPLILDTAMAWGVCLVLLSGFIGYSYFEAAAVGWLRRVFPGTGILPDFLSVILVLLASLIVILTFGYLVPRKIALQHPEKTLYRYLPFVCFLTAAVRPVTVPVRGTANFLVRIFRMDPEKGSEEVTEREIISIVDEAHEQGVIKENEAEMIQNIISFEDTEAKDVMTHRKNIVALEGTATLKEATDFILENSNSRYPVYSGDIDNIIGIIHLKDAVKMRLAGPENDTIAIEDIPNLVREATIIPETRSIDSIFQLMRSKKMHIVIVVDEYGQTSGLITMEDILEEIVGSILDEYDDDEQYIQHSFDNSIVMDGLTPLDRVGEVLDYDFSGNESETLNGYLTALLDHVPTPRDKFVRGKKFQFRILRVENHVIKKVRVERLPGEKGEEPCQDIQNSQT